MSSPALQIRPPQIDSPLTTLGQLANLRGVQTENLLRQQQIRQSQAQEQDIQAQAALRDRDIADENTLKSGLGDPKIAAQVGNGDLSYFNGKVSPTNLLKFQEGVTKAHKEASLASVEDLNKNKAFADQATESLFGLNQLPDDEAVAHYSSVRQLLLDQGNKLAEHAPPTITSKKDLAKIEADLNLTAGINSKALALKGEQAKQAQAEGAAAKEQAEASKAITERENLIAGKPKIEADAARAKYDSDFAAAHGGLTPDQLATTNETARHNKKEEAVQGGELAIKQKTFDATLGSGLDANGQPLSPEAMKTAALQDPTAVAIAHYRVAPPPATTRGGLPNPILRKVMAINPQYDATTFPARAETAKGFSPSGVQGQAITAADTALAHLATISKAGEALKNGDVQLINKIANEVGAQTGSSPKETYNTILNMVGPEISKSVIGAVGGEGERAGTKENYSSTLNDSTREANIGATVGLLGARYDKAAHAYEQQMGVPLPRTLSPESQAIRQKYTGGGAGGHQSVPHVTSKSQFDALPSGAIYTEDDGKQYRKP